MAIHDVSVPIRPGMPIYHDNPGFSIELDSAIAEGEVANVSKLTMGAHTGTHIDGPSHFYDGGPGTDSLSLDAMIGPARVVALPDAAPGAITAEMLVAAGVTDPIERLLLKTPNSELWARDEFTRDFARLDGSAAEHLLTLGIRLVGIDYLSIGDPDAHRALLGAGVVALEGLDLRGIDPGPYELICLPLRLIGSDGCPARALIADSAEGSG